VNRSPNFNFGIEVEDAYFIIQVAYFEVVVGVTTWCVVTFVL